MRIPFVLFLIFLSPTQADFYYPDFATVCDPAFPCSPDFEVIYQRYRCFLPGCW